jgi:hypothetical protein
MKKILLSVGVFSFFLGLLIFIGCQKSSNLLSSQHKVPETNVRLVPDSVAFKIAEAFNPSVFFNASNPSNYSKNKSSLNGQNKIKAHFTIKDSYDQPAFYIYNFEDNAGFLFVSADSGLSPVLAFIEKGEFKKEVVSAGILKWVGKTINDIEIVREGLFDNSKSAKSAWNNYLTQNEAVIPKVNTTLGVPPPPPPLPSNVIPTVVSIGPLLPVTWGQQCTYNELCGNPATNYNCSDNLSCSTRPTTGCVATAAAQLINKWQPINGYGYNYASMPTSSGNAEVQRLMSDVGKSINMAYTCASAGGSSASGGDVPSALLNNFGLASAKYDSYDYYYLVSNLLNNWPVLLDGCATATQHWVIINWWTSYSDCHEWVCDGFSGTIYKNRIVTVTSNKGVTTITYQPCSACVDNGYFHMNWGWHEVSPFVNDQNGWFLYNNWYILGQNEDFQYADGITHEIHL